MNQDKEFLTKLKNLLSEYKADISWSCGSGSDTHGIHDEYMTVSIEDREILKRRYQSSIQASDIEL